MILPYIMAAKDSTKYRRKKRSIFENKKAPDTTEALKLHLVTLFRRKGGFTKHNNTNLC